MNSRIVRRVLIGVLGVAWIALGFLSDNVPWFSESFWIIACAAAGGSAFALAHFATMYALKRYAVIVGAIGSLRSAAYGHHGQWGPMLVWVILFTTTIAALAAIAAQHSER